MYQAYHSAYDPSSTYHMSQMHISVNPSGSNVYANGMSDSGSLYTGGPNRGYENDRTYYEPASFHSNPQHEYRQHTGGHGSASRGDSLTYSAHSRGVNATHATHQYLEQQQSLAPTASNPYPMDSYSHYSASSRSPANSAISYYEHSHQYTPSASHHSHSPDPAGRYLPTTSNPVVSISSNTPAKSCSNCGATTTPMWRRNPLTHEPLCNACGIYLQTRHKQRPYELISASRGEEESIELQEEIPEGWEGPVCSHCSTRSTSVWRRGKEGEQLCNACGVYVRLRGKERPLNLRRNKVRTRTKHD